MNREVPSPSLAEREWDEQLRARGYRATPHRQLILEAVARLSHGTPEEIAAQTDVGHLTVVGRCSECRGTADA